MEPDKRIGEFIGNVKAGEDRVRLIGFPSDEGVRINGGRQGAAKAPRQIIERLLTLTPHAGFAEKHTAILEKVSGPNYLTCTGDVASDQKMLGSVTSLVLSDSRIPVIIGGGHETSYGHFLGYVQASQPIHILNIDAHTDVRALKNGKPHSGSPFRQALEHPSGMCKSYSVFGLNPSSVSSDHFQFAQKSGDVLTERDLNVEFVIRWFKNRSHEPVMVTMDMDAVHQAYAPGVSAPNPSGIDRTLWLEIAFECGRQPNVTSFDLCEVNPDFDRDNQTVRLAALTAWYFLLGVALR